MTTKKIHRKIEGTPIHMIWYGGHGIHIYKNGREIDLINIGDFSKDEATREEVLEKMNRLKKGEWKEYGW